MVMPKLSIRSLVLMGALVVMTIASVQLLMARNAEKVKRIWTEDQLRKVTAAKEELEEEKEELTKAKEAVEAKVSDLSNQAKTLADQLATEKRARELLTSEMAKVRDETTNLKGRLDTERKEKLTLTEDLAKAKQSYQALSNELTTLRQAKEALEKRVKEMLSARAKEAEQIVVKPPEKKALEGKVLVVNREFGFAVMNLGSKDGIASGTIFSVWKQDKEVGKVQVERIYENMSAANIIGEPQKGQIQEGDSVRQVS